LGHVRGGRRLWQRRRELVSSVWNDCVRLAFRLRSFFKTTALVFLLRRPSHHAAKAFMACDEGLCVNLWMGRAVLTGALGGWRRREEGAGRRRAYFP